MSCDWRVSTGTPTIAAIVLLKRAGCCFSPTIPAVMLSPRLTGSRKYRPSNDTIEPVSRSPGASRDCDRVSRRHRRRRKRARVYGIAYDRHRKHICSGWGPPRQCGYSERALHWVGCLKGISTWCSLSTRSRAVCSHSSLSALVVDGSGRRSACSRSNRLRSIAPRTNSE
jgi:hypothetical protein